MARKATVHAVSATASRYQRVKAILDAAAGASKSDYGGAGRFWDDLATLKDARVHGIAMIAPEQQAPCCEPETRSARSGLIKGLRGQAPFDGRRFPPLRRRTGRKRDKVHPALDPVQSAAALSGRRSVQRRLCGVRAGRGWNEVVSRRGVQSGRRSHPCVQISEG